MGIHKRKLYVCISLDVEEEGLFCGNYPSTNLSMRNVPLLKRLAPLSQDLGYPLTLFCTYGVFRDARSGETLRWMQQQCGAEIGAHLHHWHTPPLSHAMQAGEPQRTHTLDRHLLEQRISSLLKIGEKFLGHPLTSFRMGRWDLKKEVLPLLIAGGIEVDSSVAPLRIFKNGPDHFLARADPYWVGTENGKILEAPITQIPLCPAMAKIWHRLAAGKPDLCDRFHFFGALSANPFWHGAGIMRLAAILHVLRGGVVLNLFWHSSELMPHGSPHVPNQDAADMALKKIFSFCAWLNKNFNVAAVTASSLAHIPPAQTYPILKRNRLTDW